MFQETYESNKDLKIRSNNKLLMLQVRENIGICRAYHAHQLRPLGVSLFINVVWLCQQRANGYKKPIFRRDFRRETYT